jgi:histidinol-phosphate aminotransferase
MKVKPNIETLIPYESKQIDVPIVLNANESSNYLFPNGFPLQIAFEKYPNSNADSLRNALATKYNLEKDNFIIGNGSTDLLELAVKTFTEPGDYVITFDPSFSMYDIYAQIHGATMLKVASNDDTTQDITLMIAQAKTYQPSIIFLCTPNNPTGYMNTREDIISLLDSTDALVIVDEAYMDFAFEKESVKDLVNVYPNLIVARTFSKAYGLAALRLGYFIASKPVIRNLLKVKLPYSVNQVSVAIGLEALSKTDEVERFLQSVVEERERLSQELQTLPLEVFPSYGNFLYVKTNRPIQEELLEKGILIRSFGKGTYRITVGTRDENTQLINALQEVTNEN